MQIDIFSDPICPWCFIGKRRLERALSQRTAVQPRIRWRAFQLNPAMPEQGMERQAYLSAKFGSASDAERLYGHIAQVGAVEGIPFAFDRIEITPNTVNAHRLIRLAGRAGKQDDVVQALFDAYFLLGRDIGDRTTLISIAVEAGLDAVEVDTLLAGPDEVDVVRNEDMRARQLGIEGVPCFIVNKRYALSGAQEPEAFFSIFDMVTEESRHALQSG